MFARIADCAELNGPKLSSREYVEQMCSGYAWNVVVPETNFMTSHTLSNAS